jgi:hypothetical protein
MQAPSCPTRHCDDRSSPDAFVERHTTTIWRFIYARSFLPLGDGCADLSASSKFESAVIERHHEQESMVHTKLRSRDATNQPENAYHCALVELFNLKNTDPCIYKHKVPWHMQAAAACRHSHNLREGARRVCLQPPKLVSCHSVNSFA